MSGQDWRRSAAKPQRGTLSSFPFFFFTFCAQGLNTWRQKRTETSPQLRAAYATPLITCRSCSEQTLQVTLGCLHSSRLVLCFNFLGSCEGILCSFDADKADDTRKVVASSAGFTLWSSEIKVQGFCDFVSVLEVFGACRDLICTLQTHKGLCVPQRARRRVHTGRTFGSQQNRP